MNYPRLSPDGKRLAVARRDPQSRTWDIYVIDLARGASSRLTFDPGDDRFPVWSPDGSHIAWRANRDGTFQIYQKLASGVGPEELLLKADVSIIPTVGRRMAASSFTLGLIRKRDMICGCCRSLETASPRCFCRRRSARPLGVSRPTDAGSLTPQTIREDSRCTCRPFPLRVASGRFRPVAANSRGGGAMARSCTTFPLTGS